jgi:hypothetical protein
MIYFSSVFLWISPHSVEIRQDQSAAGFPGRPKSSLLIVLKEFNLAKSLFCLLARFVRAAEILAALF